MPDSLRFERASDAGNRSCKTVMEFGILTTFSYFEIFVMKFLGDKSSEMGMRTRRTVRWSK